MIFLHVLKKKIILKLLTFLLLDREKIKLINHVLQNVTIIDAVESCHRVSKIFIFSENQLQGTVNHLNVLLVIFRK